MSKPSTKSPFTGTPCPKCGQPGVSISLETFDWLCSECSEISSRADVERIIDQWRKVLEWQDRALDQPSTKAGN